MYKIKYQKLNTKNTNKKLKSLISKSFLFLICVFCFWSLIFSFSSFAQDSSKEDESFFVAKKAIDDGFYEVGLELLERFLKSYPGSSKIQEANLLIGLCFFHQNKFMDAFNKFNALIKDPQAKNIKDALLYWSAEVYFRGNDFINAAKYYKMVVDEFPNSSYAALSFYSLGWCLFQEREFGEALKYFKVIEERFPKDAQAQDALFKIIECLYNLKDYVALKDKTKPYLKIYAKDVAKLAHIYFYLAEADYYLNNFNDAIDEYKRAISSTSDDKILALSQMGMVWTYLKSKQYKEAQETLAGIKKDNLDKDSFNILLLAKAALYFETSRFPEAKDVYSELLASATDSVTSLQAYIGKADALYSLGDFKEAISVYKEALEKLNQERGIPQEIVDKLHYGLAWVYLKEGQFKEAIDQFQKVAKQAEDKIIKVSALCQIGDTYQNSGDYQKAAQIYDSIIKDYPDSFYSDYVQYQLGLSMIKISNYEGAILAFQALKKNFPQSKLLDDATYALGLAYFQGEDYASSQEAFEKFQTEFKDTSIRPQAMYLLGSSLYNLGKFPEAIEIFKEIAKTYNQDIELVQKAEYEIADCFYRMGNDKEAMQRFKALRAKYPDSKLTVEVVWWLGEYYYRQNDLNLARRYFSSLIQDFPKSSLLPSAYYALGSTYIEEGRYSEAIDNFSKVVELDNSDLGGTAAIAIADIYKNQEKTDLAQDLYQKTIKEHANLAHLIYPKIADIYFKTDRYSEALELYRKSLDVVPVKEIPNIQFRIAQTLEADGKTSEAVQEYLRTSYLYAENSDLATKALLRVAAIYEDKEDFKEAANIYKRVVEMNVEESKYAQERVDWIKANIKDLK